VDETVFFARPQNFKMQFTNLPSIESEHVRQETQFGGKWSIQKVFPQKEFFQTRETGEFQWNWSGQGVFVQIQPFQHFEVSQFCGNGGHQVICIEEQMGCGG
jgi:hypothetical protein